MFLFSKNFRKIYNLFKSQQVTHEDFVEGIMQVMQKKKAGLDYYA